MHPLIIDSVEQCETSTQALSQVLIFAIIFLGLIIIIGGIGNFLVIATIIHQTWLPENLRILKIRKPNYILLTNLAIADLLYCWVNLPMILKIYVTIYVNDMVRTTCIVC